jgi:hypothetical protein
MASHGIIASDFAFLCFRLQAEREWQRLERQQRQQEVERLSRSQRPNETMLMSTIDLDAQGRAATQQRPTAYMPTVEGSLPIPKPFGRFAPFRPAEPAPNLRYLRRTLPSQQDSEEAGEGDLSRSLVSDIVV